MNRVKPHLTLVSHAGERLSIHITEYRDDADTTARGGTNVTVTVATETALALADKLEEWADDYRFKRLVGPKREEVETAGPAEVAS